MRFRDRLVLIGILLVVLPSGLVMGIYSYIMSTRLTADAGMLVRTKLDLLENRVAASHDVLERAGIADNVYYSGVALSAIASAFEGVMAPGESFLVLDADGRVLQGPPAQKGTSLAEGDPLRIQLARAPSSEAAGAERDSTRILRSPSFASSGGASIVAWRRYAPWGLTLVVASEEARAFAPLDSAMRLSLALAFVLLALAGALLLFLAQRLSEPLIRISAFAKALGDGERGLSLPEGGTDEIAALARSFNEMARKMDALTTGLEIRVEERTLELSTANRRLQEVNDDLASSLDRVEKMRTQLVESEKLVALGQLVASIAHELNTPLGAASMGAQTLGGILAGLPDHLERLAALEPGLRSRVLGAVLDEREAPRPALSRTERARLGEGLGAQLRDRAVADWAGAADLLLEAGWRETEIPEGLEGEELAELALALYELSGLARSAGVISAATTQAVRVIEALRTYARQDAPQALVPVDVVANVEQVLTLFSSKIKLGIEVSRAWTGLPFVLGSAEKLAQVWTNLVSNALQAMNYRGRLALSSALVGDMVLVSIVDSGPGIPSQVREHIFTPFFTTKPPGEGTGLGLEISRRIVEGLGGRIEFDSQPGRTEFRVYLPAMGALGGEGPAKAPH